MRDESGLYWNSVASWEDMRTGRKNRSDLRDFNVLIYSKSPEKLWEYREVCYRIKEKISGEIEITLANRIQTVWNIIRLLSGEIDIFISDDSFDEETIKKLELKVLSESYYIITKKKNEYISIYRINKNMKCIEHWENKRSVLEENMLHIILKMQKNYEI